MEARLALMSFAPGLGAPPAEATAMAGGKGASLSSMAAAGLPVPPGVIICTSAFEWFLEYHGTDRVIAEIARSLDVDDEQALAAAADRIRTPILENTIPPDIDEA